MKIVSVKDGFEQAFWDYVNRDFLDYYFFVLDWKQNRDKTEISLAMRGEKVQGAMLVYDGYIVQLRGTHDAAKSLFDHVNFQRIELQAPPSCKDFIAERYKPQTSKGLILMSLKTGEENIQITQNPVQLGIEDAEAVAEIMRRADPEWWGDVTAEGRKSNWNEVYWLGIKHRRKLVAVGSTRFVDFGSNIGVIATDERYRNKGYATSLVSALAQEIQRRSSTPIIHVVNDNAPAIRVYTKVGFRPRQHYALMRAERINN